MKVCAECFNDIELRQFIESNSSERGECSYCRKGVASALLDINELLDFFEEFIAIFEVDPDGTPLYSIIQKDWNLFSIDSTSSNLLSDILLLLHSPITSSQELVTYSSEIKDSTAYWDTLKEELKWERRFLTDTSKLEELKWHVSFNETVKLTHADTLFRARLHENAEQIEIETKEMGSPPRHRARAGRANPQGISYLYLSKSVTTTLHEVRATYLDEVSVGTFEVADNSELILVDFTEPASAFSHETEITEYAKRLLLKKHISTELSKPIRRYDSELEYIPTQFICEYIRYVAREQPDGIIFNSSLHDGGKNIVLFSQDKVRCVSVSKHRVTRFSIEEENLSI